MTVDLTELLKGRLPLPAGEGRGGGGGGSRLIARAKRKKMAGMDSDTIAGMTKVAAIALFALAALLPGTAFAACTSPAAPEGSLQYFTVGTTFKYCDGTNWVSWGGSGGTPAGADRQVQFNSAGAFGAASTFVYTATGNVGIGTAAPGDVLHVASDAVENLARLEYAGNTAGTDSELSFARSRGTLSAKTVVSSDDNIGSLWAYGYDGTDMEAAAAIEFEVDGTPNNDTTDMPGRIVFKTTPDGSDVPVERMRIDDAGNIGIGDTSPSALLHLKMSALGDILTLESDGEPFFKIMAANNSATENPLIWTTKSRGTSTARTAVASGDTAVEWYMKAYDGAADRDLAYITARVDGTPGSNDMPGRIEFHTQADGAGASLEGTTPEMVIKNDGKVGIGTASPASKLHLSDNALTSLGITSATSASTIDSGEIGFYRARGTVGAPTAVVNTDYLSAIWSYGYDGSAYRAAAVILVEVDATPGTNDMPGRIRFYTTPDGSGGPAERMRITNAGNVGIGTTTPAAKFVVDPPASEVVASAGTITANACGTIKEITSSGSVTTNTTNTFTAPTVSYAGCCMTVINVDTADTITLDANTAFKTIGGANQALGPSDVVQVCSNGTNWYQVGAVSANQ